MSSANNWGSSKAKKCPPTQIHICMYIGDTGSQKTQIHTTHIHTDAQTNVHTFVEFGETGDIVISQYPTDRRRDNKIFVCGNASGLRDVQCPEICTRDNYDSSAERWKQNIGDGRQEGRKGERKGGR